MTHLASSDLVCGKNLPRQTRCPASKKNKTKKIKKKVGFVGDWPVQSPDGLGRACGGWDAPAGSFRPWLSAGLLGWTSWPRSGKKPRATARGKAAGRPFGGLFEEAESLEKPRFYRVLSEVSEAPCRSSLGWWLSVLGGPPNTRKREQTWSKNRENNDLISAGSGPLTW